MYWGIPLFAGILIAGCTKDNGGPVTDVPPPGVTNETQAMQSMASSDQFVENEEVTMADQSMETMDYGTFGKIDAAITPLRWGRFVTSVTTTVTATVLPGDTIAIAHVSKLISGSLKVRGTTGAGDTVTITKPFTDSAAHNIIFKRVARLATLYWRNWVPVATSLVDGGTTPAPAGASINITRLDVFLPQGDTITVTDPTNYYLRYRWVGLFTGGRKDCPVFAGGDQIKLRATVVSESPDTDIVVLRFGFDVLHRRRVRMAVVSEVHNLDGTYTREYELSWFANFHPGYFHAGVDAVTRATLFDDSAPYSVSWWGVPYRVL